MTPERQKKLETIHAKICDLREEIDVCIAEEREQYQSMPMHEQISAVGMRCLDNRIGLNGAFNTMFEAATYIESAVK